METAKIAGDRERFLGFCHRSFVSSRLSPARVLNENGGERMKYYDINHLPQHGRFGAYHKRDSANDTLPTLAAHVRGEFIVNTRNGEHACNDAYIMVDPEGYPYSINRKAFEETYEKIPTCCG